MVVEKRCKEILTDGLALELRCDRMIIQKVLLDRWMFAVLAVGLNLGRNYGLNAQKRAKDHEN